MYVYKFTIIYHLYTRIYIYLCVCVVCIYIYECSDHLWDTICSDPGAQVELELCKAFANLAQLDPGLDPRRRYSEIAADDPHGGFTINIHRW